MKRIISLFLVLLMVFSLSTVVTAENSNKQDVYAQYVTQTSDDEIIPTINVDVAWGKMEFTYTVTETKKWNAATHMYDTILSDGEWTATGNTVTVSNHSDTEIVASFAYESDPSYSEIQGRFSKSKVVLTAAEPTTTPSAEVSLDLTGKLPASATTMQKVGTITVSVEEAMLPETVEESALPNNDDSNYLENMKLGGSFADGTAVPVIADDQSLVISATAASITASGLAIENADDLSARHVTFDVYYRLQGNSTDYYHVFLEASRIELGLARYNFYCNFLSTGMHLVFDVDQTYEFVIAVYVDGENIGYGETTLEWTQELADKLA